MTNDLAKEPLELFLKLWKSQEEEKVAAKFIDGKKKERKTIHKIWTNMARIRNLRHRNVTQILNIFLENNNGKPDIWVFMEICDRNLDVHCKEHILSSREILWLMRDIAKGVEYLHQNGTIHQDLKPANILITGVFPAVAKLSDFDLRRTVFDDHSLFSSMFERVGTK